MNENIQKSAVLEKLEYLENFLKENSIQKISEYSKEIMGQIVSGIKEIQNSHNEFLITRFLDLYKNLKDILTKDESLEKFGKIYFLSFGDKRLVKSLERIRRQAEEMNIFSEIYCWTQDEIDRDFWERWKHKIPFDGFDYKSTGYFIWKPQIITQVLEKMKDGDILLYCDCGNHLHKHGRRRLVFYLDILNRNETGILCFQQHELPERQWTKGDIFDYFACRDKSEIYNTGQMCGGVIFFRKCGECMEFVKKWRQVFLENFELHDADTFNSPNFDDFIANRGEQSTLSILAKLTNAAVIPAAEIYAFPITAARDKEYTLQQ